MRVSLPLPAAILMLAATARAQPHATDVWVGQSGGRLAWTAPGLIPGTVYHPLFRVDTFLQGWSNNDPGWDRLGFSVGTVAPLPQSARVWLKVVSLDPAFFALNLLTNPPTVLELPGDAAFLGTGNDLHTHLTWFIDETDPRFDSERCAWEATFVLDDRGGGLADSLPFTLLFSNVPVRGGEFPPMNTPASGDWDGDRRVEDDDVEPLGVCVNGPMRRTEPGDPGVTTCEVDCYNAFDFDDDLDVDLLDVAEFMVRWDG